VAEACNLKLSDKRWNHGRWVLRVRIKGRGERTIPLPDDVREAIDEYLKLDRNRRLHLHSDGPEQFIFQPLVIYRTLEFNKPLSSTQAWHIAVKASILGCGISRLPNLLQHDERAAPREVKTRTHHSSASSNTAGLC
jgi:integrase